MPYVRNDSKGQDELFVEGTFIPYGDSYSYQGRNLRGGTLFESEPKKEEKKASSASAYVSDRDRMRIRSNGAKYAVSQASIGAFKAQVDVIAPKDVRPLPNPRANRQLTPFEMQVTEILGWIQAHRETGTLNGKPDRPTDFEAQFEVELLGLAQERGDEFSIAAHIARRDFLEYEQTFKDEDTARSAGPLAKYSRNLPDPNLPISGAPSMLERAELSRTRLGSESLEENSEPRKRRISPGVVFFCFLLALVALWALAQTGLLGNDLARLTRFR